MKIYSPPTGSTFPAETTVTIMATCSGASAGAKVTCHAVDTATGKTIPGTASFLSGNKIEGTVKLPKGHYVIYICVLSKTGAVLTCDSIIVTIT